MCVKTYSESGQPCGFEPCDAFKRMKSQYAATNLSLCEINKERRDDIERLEAENSALCQENQLLRAENANLSMAHGPGNHTDWMLTRASKYEQLHKDLEQLRQDRDRLSGVVEKTPQWIEHDGSFSTLPGEDERILIHRYQSSGHLFCDASKPCWWVDAIKDFAPLRPGDRWMPWPGGE